MTKVTAVGFEALVLAPEAPTPIPLPLAAGVPINPMTFPPDWGGEITLKTRWLTDVTKPYSSDRTERWALTSRPSRTLEVQLTGMSKDESNAMLLAAQAATDYHGSPVPIYPDAVTVTGASGAVLQGNFACRRFFRGGRVVIYPTSPETSRNDAKVFHATVVSVSPTEVEVDAVERPVTTNDTVAPCLDAEMAEEASGVALTDSVWQVTMTWNEVEGACTLPATWPATTVESADVLSPICQIVDDLPVFPFEANWRDGVDVSPAREISSSPLGRSMVKNPQGMPHLRCSIALMGYDRQRTWNILRFFDSMRGRAGSFYLVHPMRPWTPYTTLVPSGALDKCYIRPIGDRESVARYVKRVAMFRADGTILVRKVTDVLDMGDHFRLSLESALPDTDFVDAQPIMVCSFDQDELEEVWSTSEVVPAMQLKIIENPDPGPVSISNQTALQFTVPSPGLLEIGGLNLLLRAGAGCYSADGRPCGAWPGNSKIATWHDESQGPNRQNRQTEVDRIAVARSGRSNHLVRFPGAWENNKQVSIMEAGFDLSYMLSSDTPVAQRSLWTEDGWTLCVCITPGATLLSTPGIDRHLALIAEPGGSPPRFALLNDTATSARSGVYACNAAGTGIYQDLSLSYRTFGSAVYFTVRADATHLRVWINGRQALSSAMALAGGLYLGSVNYNTSKWFEGLGTGYTDPNSTTILPWLFPTVGCANLVASYNRALSVEEIDRMHVIVSDMFRTTYDSVSLY